MYSGCISLWLLLTTLLLPFTVTVTSVSVWRPIGTGEVNAKEQERMIRAIFDTCDTDGTGDISKEELVAALDKLATTAEDKKHLQMLVNSMESTESISFDGFVRAYKSFRSLYDEDQALTNGTGNLDGSDHGSGSDDDNSDDTTAASAEVDGNIDESPISIRRKKSKMAAGRQARCSSSSSAKLRRRSLKFKRKKMSLSKKKRTSGSQAEGGDSAGERSFLEKRVSESVEVKAEQKSGKMRSGGKHSWDAQKMMKLRGHKIRASDKVKVLGMLKTVHRRKDHAEGETQSCAGETMRHRGLSKSLEFKAGVGALVKTRCAVEAVPSEGRTGCRGDDIPEPAAMRNLANETPAMGEERKMSEIEMLKQSLLAAAAKEKVSQKTKQEVQTKGHFEFGSTQQTKMDGKGKGGKEGKEEKEKEKGGEKKIKKRKGNHKVPDRGLRYSRSTSQDLGSFLNNVDSGGDLSVVGSAVSDAVTVIELSEEQMAEKSKTSQEDQTRAETEGGSDMQEGTVSMTRATAATANEDGLPGSRGRRPSEFRTNHEDSLSWAEVGGEEDMDVETLRAALRAERQHSSRLASRVAELQADVVQKHAELMATHSFLNSRFGTSSGEFQVQAPSRADGLLASLCSSSALLSLHDGLPHHVLPYYMKPKHAMPFHTKSGRTAIQEFDSMRTENAALAGQARALTERVTMLEITKAELGREVQAGAAYVEHLVAERESLLKTTSRAVQHSKMKERASLARVRDMEKVMDRHTIQLRFLKSLCSRLQSSLQNCSAAFDKEDDLVTDIARELAARDIVDVPTEITARRRVMRLVLARSFPGVRGVNNSHVKRLTSHFEQPRRTFSTPNVGEKLSKMLGKKSGTSKGSPIMDARQFDIEAALSRTPTPSTRYRRLGATTRNGHPEQKANGSPLGPNRRQGKGIPSSGKARSNTMISFDQWTKKTQQAIAGANGTLGDSERASEGASGACKRGTSSTSPAEKRGSGERNKAKGGHSWKKVKRKSPGSGGKKLGPSVSAQRDADMRAPTSDSEKWRLAALRDEARLKEEKKREQSARRAHKIRIAENMLRLENEAKKRRRQVEMKKKT